MDLEHELVRFVCRTAYHDLRPQILSIIKNQILTVLGTTIAGSTQAGCQTLADFSLAGRKGGGRHPHPRRSHFQDCIAHAEKPLEKGKVEKIIQSVSHLEELRDVCALIPLLLH